MQPAKNAQWVKRNHEKAKLFAQHLEREFQKHDIDATPPDSQIFKLFKSLTLIEPKYQKSNWHW